MKIIAITQYDNKNEVEVFKTSASITKESFEDKVFGIINKRQFTTFLGFYPYKGKKAFKDLCNEVEA